MVQLACIAQGDQSEPKLRSAPASRPLRFATSTIEPLSEWRGLPQRMAEWVVYSALCIDAWRLVGADVS